MLGGGSERERSSLGVKGGGMQWRWICRALNEGSIGLSTEVTLVPFNQSRGVIIVRGIIFIVPY